MNNRISVLSYLPVATFTSRFPRLTLMDTIYSPSKWAFRSREYLGTNHLNYGFWIDDENLDLDKHSSSRSQRNRDVKAEYSKSHAQLLHKLLEFIEFQIDHEYANKNVLFAACGCGHEVLEFARYVAGRESIAAQTTRSKRKKHAKNGKYRVIGLEFVESQVAFAKELASSTLRLPQLQSDSISITIIQGDACNLSNHIDSHSISTLICLDAAYHFSPSRLTFLHQAFKVLSSSSSPSSSSSSSAQSLCFAKLGLVDFIFPCTDSLLLPFYLPILSFLHLAGIPFQNQVSLSLYRSCLVQAGFTNIKITSISQQVFPGFKKHVLLAFSKRTPDQPLFTWFPLLAIAYMMELLFRLRVIDSVLVSATKP